MLKKFDTIVTQFDGTPWKNEKGEPLTVANCIVTALGGTYEDERALAGPDKHKRFFLGERIYNSGSTPTEVSAEDIVLMKACVAKGLPTYVVGFVFTDLEKT
jgi:hypothetical protein